MISIQHLNELLNDRLESLLPELIGGRKKGREWVAASQSEGGIGDSLSVGLLGTKRGKWFHHAAAVGGDVLELICYMRTNGDKGRGIGWAREFLGGTIPEDSDEARKQRAQRLRAAGAKEKRERQRDEGQARYTFFKKSEDLKGTPAWSYLDRRLEGNMARLGHAPGCLRFCAKLYNSQLDQELPGMVAAIVNAGGEMIGVHRTWLIPRDGGWDRLREEDGVGRDGKRLMGKKVLGSWRHACIRLWAGTRENIDTGEIKRGLPWPQVAAGSAIMLCEGIETGLSLALIAPERRIVATVSIDGFVNVELPETFTQVTIAAENDTGNERTKDAIERAREAHASAGRRLTIMWPPAGFDDWNTVLRSIKGRAA